MGDFSSADLDAINQAIASGALTVRFSGPPERSVTYRSLAELLTIKQKILDSLNGTPTRSRQTILVGHKFSR